MNDRTWSRNPIDRFVLAKIEASGLSPNPEAERRALIRRVSLDLTGATGVTVITCRGRDGQPHGATVNAFTALTKVELRLFLREPLTVVFVLVLPVVLLYVLNGVFGSTPDPTVWEGQSPVDFYTSAYVALVAATAGVLSLPVHLAGYREQGVLRRFRASAVSPVALVGAHVTVTAAMAAAGAVLLTDGQGLMLHMAAFVAEDVVFTKNGFCPCPVFKPAEIRNFGLVAD